jgi:hypothetical protein
MMSTLFLWLFWVFLVLFWAFCGVLPQNMGVASKKTTIECGSNGGSGRLPPALDPQFNKTHQEIPGVLSLPDELKEPCPHSALYAPAGINGIVDNIMMFLEGNAFLPGGSGDFHAAHSQRGFSHDCLIAIVHHPPQGFSRFRIPDHSQHITKPLPDLIGG